MNRASLLRVFPSLVVSLLLLAAPVCFAGPHGGGGFHGGGGGFHGGGGGGYHGASAAGAYHGGGWGGGYHGGGYYGGGYHGGSYYGRGYYRGYGWGGGWGYPGWGFGIGVSFGWGGYGGWGGYWPAYPYSYPYYGYAPPCSAYYPCYPYYSYPSPYYSPVSNPPVAPAAYVNTARAAQPAPAQYSAPEYQTVPMPPRSNAVTVMNVSYRRGASSYSTASYSPPKHTSPQVSEQRPAVQNVIRALRAMPPAARERQLVSGRYNDFSPQEMRFVRSAAEIPSAE